MTAFLKKHRKTKKIFSITLFKSISILLTEIIFTSIAKAVLRKNGVHYEISLHSNNLGYLSISDALEENDEKLVEFAVGGLCNAVLGRDLTSSFIISLLYMSLFNLLENLIPTQVGLHSLARDLTFRFRNKW